jgi:hypothetical protein
MSVLVWINPQTSVRIVAIGAIGTHTAIGTIVPITEAMGTRRGLTTMVAVRRSASASVEVGVDGVTTIGVTTVIGNEKPAAMRAFFLQRQTNASVRSPPS